MLNNKDKFLHKFWCASFLACFVYAALDLPVIAEKKENTLLRGSIVKTVSVTPAQLESLLRANLASQNGTALPARITQMDLEGVAKSSGLEIGDQILSATASRNLLVLTASRAGSQFRLRIDMMQASLSRERALLADVLDPSSPAEKPAEPELAAVVNKNTPEKPKPAPSKPRALTEADTKGNKVLEEKEVVLLIDCSKSMATVDCPGNQSRWNWCKNETIYLGWSDPEVLKRGLSLVTFSSGYNLYNNRTLADVERVYSEGHPHGLTYLAQPLNQVLGEYLSRRRRSPRIKPLVVAVISDGYPIDIDKVKQVIVRSSFQMSSPEQSRIVFIQISDDKEGSRILADLDNNLATVGARYDIVDTESFANVRRIGIKQALVDAIVAPHAGGHPVVVQSTNTSSGKGFAKSAPANQSKQDNDSEAERLQLEKMILDKQ